MQEQELVLGSVLVIKRYRYELKLNLSLILFSYVLIGLCLIIILTLELFVTFKKLRREMANASHAMVHVGKNVKVLSTPLSMQGTLKVLEIAR